MNRIPRILIAATVALGVCAPNALAAPTAVIDTSATPVTCGPLALCVGYVTSPGVSVGFGALYSDPGPGSDNIKKVEFDLNGNGIYDYTSTDVLKVARWTFQAPARDVVIKLRVTNTAGQTDEATLPLRINTPPQAKLDMPDSVVAGTPFTVDASGSTDDQSGLTYAFDVLGGGFGTPSTLATQKSTIFVPGTYAIGLKVYDRHGSSQQMARTLTVLPAPTAQVQTGPAKLTGKKVGVRVACPRARDELHRLPSPSRGRASRPRRFSIAGGTTTTVGVKASKAARKEIKRLGSIATTATAGDSTAAITLVR